MAGVVTVTSATSAWPSSALRAVTNSTTHVVVDGDVSHLGKFSPFEPVKMIGGSGGGIMGAVDLNNFGSYDPTGSEFHNIRFAGAVQNRVENCWFNYCRWLEVQSHPLRCRYNSSGTRISNCFMERTTIPSPGTDVIGILFSDQNEVITGLKIENCQVWGYTDGIQFQHTPDTGSSSSRGHAAGGRIRNCTFGFRRAMFSNATNFAEGCENAVDLKFAGTPADPLIFEHCRFVNVGINSRNLRGYAFTCHRCGDGIKVIDCEFENCGEMAFVPIMYNNNVQANGAISDGYIEFRNCILSGEYNLTPETVSGYAWSPAITTLAGNGAAVFARRVIVPLPTGASSAVQDGYGGKFYTSTINTVANTWVADYLTNSVAPSNAIYVCEQTSPGVFNETIAKPSDFTARQNYAGWPVP